MTPTIPSLGSEQACQLRIVADAVQVLVTAGQVLVPGKQVKVAWEAAFPHVDLDWCEMEVWLSLDGGTTFTLCLTPHVDPAARYFYWTVPNTPTNAAVLDIRFGCEWYYPESYSPQTASVFTITQSSAALY